MRLTREQRSALFRGECPRITFPGSRDCPVEVGHIEILSRNVSLEVTAIRRTRKGEHSLSYVLHNRNLGQRYIAKQAGQTSPAQYTSSPTESIDHEAGQAVDDFTQRRFTREGQDRERQRQIEDVAEILGAMEELRCAIDDMPEERKRRMSRTLWQLRSRLDSAEREMRKRLAA